MVPIVIDDFSAVIVMRISIPTKTSNLTHVKYYFFQIVGQVVIIIRHTTRREIALMVVFMVDDRVNDSLCAPPESETSICITDFKSFVFFPGANKKKHTNSFDQIPQESF
jgi:hypothetical protein